MQMEVPQQELQMQGIKKCEKEIVKHRHFFDLSKMPAIVILYLKKNYINLVKF